MLDLTPPPDARVAGLAAPLHSVRRWPAALLATALLASCVSSPTPPAAADLGTSVASCSLDCPEGNVQCEAAVGRLRAGWAVDVQNEGWLQLAARLGPVLKGVVGLGKAFGSGIWAVLKGLAGVVFGNAAQAAELGDPQAQCLNELSTAENVDRPEELRDVSLAFAVLLEYLEPGLRTATKDDVRDALFIVARWHWDNVHEGSKTSPGDAWADLVVQSRLAEAVDRIVELYDAHNKQLTATQVQGVVGVIEDIVAPGPAWPAEADLAGTVFATSDEGGVPQLSLEQISSACDALMKCYDSQFMSGEDRLQPNDDLLWALISLVVASVSEALNISNSPNQFEESLLELDKNRQLGADHCPPCIEFFFMQAGAGMNLLKGVDRILTNLEFPYAAKLRDEWRRYWNHLSWCRERGLPAE